MSARRQLLLSPLTGNYRRLRRQWCDEWRIWTTEWNVIVFNDKSRFFLQHHVDGTDCSPNLSPIENMSMLTQRLVQHSAIPDQLWQYEETGWTAVPEEYIQSLIDSLPRRVAVVIAINDGYTNY
ncbi:transposable element Tcb1 transposase [Trichonephila clavipes]|nr:transposable element Tcb1 transposase [Trichonephila clavipes]